MSRTENVELTVLCLIEDGDRSFFRTGQRTTGKGMPCREVM